MECRKRKRPSESYGHSDKVGDRRSPAGTAFGSKGSSRVQEGVCLPGTSATFSGSGTLVWWPWEPCVTTTTGLLMAVVLAVAQAWCVNAIHENLLWFSQLMVRSLF